MNKQLKLQSLLFIVFFFKISFSFGQIDKIIKSGGKLLEKSPTKLLEKYFNNAPITTSFDDAKTEVMLLGDFEPEDSVFLPLDILAQNENGNYIVTEGLYTGWNKSFCLKAGTYGPSQGDGHLLAPLSGPKAFLVRKLLENWQTKEPGIPQRDVQCLIWAIIARTDVEKMQSKYQLTLARLLDKKDIAQLAANSLKDKALEAGIEKFKGEIPAEIYNVYQAEKDLRSMYSKVDASYEQFEQYAVLAGIAPAADMIRPVSKARWSFHPNGYFIRLSPQGYPDTKVDVYMPMKMETETDALGRIISISNGADKIEFVYDKNADDGTGISSSGITEMKFHNQEITGMSVKTPGLISSFVKTSFSFEESTAPAGSKQREFIKWLNAEKGILNLDLDKAGKARLFNLSNAIRAFDAMPENSLEPGLNAYVKFMLNEAHNYTIYKNLSIGKSNAVIKNENINSESIIVVTTVPAGNSGPRTEPGNYYINEPGINSGEWFKQDKGELDLPNTVATPANRSSQRIGQSKPPKKKPWYEKLPPCPCTYKEAQDSAKRKGSGWMDCGGASQKHHYGATSEVRWAGKSGNPGQQCTYDANGDLITSGIAAGSPDKVSPQACGYTDPSVASIKSAPMHYYNDVRTWNNLPCWEYLQDWPSNNGNKCSPPNPVNDIQHMRKLVGDMTCSEITQLLDAASKSKDIDPDLRDFLQGKPNSNLNNHMITTGLNNWKARDGKPVANLIDEAIGNMK